MWTIRSVVCAAAVGTLALPNPGGAATPRPVIPSVDQYVEAVPTSAGPKYAGTREERVQPLTVAAERTVIAEAGADADVLIQVATSPRYGAPRDAKADRGVAPPSVRPPGNEEQEQRSALNDMSAEGVEHIPSRIFWLATFMGASLVAAIAFEVVRRRPR